MFGGIGRLGDFVGLLPIALAVVPKGLQDRTQASGWGNCCERSLEKIQGHGRAGLVERGQLFAKLREKPNLRPQTRSTTQQLQLRRPMRTLFSTQSGWFAPLLLIMMRLPGLAQSPAVPATFLPLDDLSGFRPAAANWRVASEVSADRSQPQSFRTGAGKGVLVNVPTDKNRDNLFSTFEHGNLELELEFMMAKGSNSGIYLQGRYEIQLFDSWGVARPQSTDCGSIYQRWDERRPEGQRGYEGHPPRVNVSRAPGLWQKMKIVFRAPTFDAQGRKRTNARFVRVLHNNVIVHEDVELTGPTQSAAFTDEKPLGPLMIQGDHGPVAFRNLRYKRSDHPPIQLNDIQYDYYEGKLEKLAQMAGANPKKTGSAGETVQPIVENYNEFGLRFSGKMRVPASGTYAFEIRCAGGGQLSVAGKPVVVHDGFHSADEVAKGTATLEAGTHPFVVNYFKSNRWVKPELHLYAEGPGVERQRLAIPTTLPDPEYVEPLVIRPDREPTMQRSFVQHREKKKTHCLSVGEPAGLHYVMDLNQGSLLHLWKGDFLEVTPMWHERGEDQLAKPVGDVIELSGEPSLATLAGDNAAWPDSITTGDGYQLKGYQLNDQGQPTFRYQVHGVDVRDQTHPDASNRFLTRQLRVKANGPNPTNLWCLLATGNRITQQPDGAYSVNDRAYYVEVASTEGSKPLIRQSKGREELLIPVRLKNGEGTITYSLVW